MFFKILRKDLKRKKAMNVILFIFMMVAGVLLASSVNLLYTTITALEVYKKEAKVADNIFLTNYDEELVRKIKNWAKNSSEVKGINQENYMNISEKNITISDKYKEFVFDNTLVVGKQPTKHNILFNQDNVSFVLKKSEIALPISMKDQMELAIGDSITVELEGYKKEFVIKHFVKDAAFGSYMIGMKRMIISESDYEELMNQANAVQMVFWSVMKADTATYDSVEKDFGKEAITPIAILNSQLITYTYIMDTLFAAIMMIVSIFLILISFLILRFTIVFTIQEDYKEIGIMKAIGIKNIAIKKLYLVKYLTLAVTGGAIGFLVSLPFSKYLMKSISNQIMIRTSIINNIISFISVSFIVIITFLFCFLCTKKINRLSAIDAIRQGTTGERFSNSKKISLHKALYLRTPVFLAISDIIVGFKRFVILIVTFILGTSIIIIPINVINTLSDSGILKDFGYGEVDFAVSSEELFQLAFQNKTEEFFQNIDEIVENAKKLGYDIKLNPEIWQTAIIYGQDINQNKSVLGMKGFNYPTKDYNYLSGVPPMLANEIAVTEILGDYLEIEIGDVVTCRVQDKFEEFIVTAMFQSMNNMGNSLRFSENFDMSMEGFNSYSLIGIFENQKIDKIEAIKVLKKEFPELKIRDGLEFSEIILGDITKQLSFIKNIIIILVAGINFLITALLVRMLLTKEIAEIAILKSIGFKNKTIRNWQSIRIAILLVISVIIGTILANTTGSILTSGIFKLMGATQMTLKINPLQVYIMYPVILLTVTMSAVFLSLGLVKKTHVWDINNQE